MRHEDLREGARRAAEKSGRKLETRLTPGEKSNRKRMAQVATVYSVAPFPRSPGDILHTLRDADEVDAKRPRPTDKRVWASVEKTARAVIREAFEEALRRDPQKARRWVVLVDGEPKQLRAVKAEARRAGVKVTILADIVHVIEYVWDAARALFGQSDEGTEEWVTDCLLALLTGRSGGDIAKTIRWWEARDKKLDDAAHNAIDKAVNTSRTARARACCGIKTRCATAFRSPPASSRGRAATSSKTESNAFLLISLSTSCSSGGASSSDVGNPLAGRRSRQSRHDGTL